MTEGSTPPVAPPDGDTQNSEDEARVRPSSAADIVGVMLEFATGRKTLVEVAFVREQGGALTVQAVRATRPAEEIDGVDLIHRDALIRALARVARVAEGTEAGAAWADRSRLGRFLELLDPANTGERPIRVTIGG